MSSDESDTTHDNVIKFEKKQPKEFYIEIVSLQEFMFVLQLMSEACNDNKQK